MKPFARGIAVAAVQCLIVLSLAGKYSYDRERLPRVWVKTAPYDPNLPIRGRYVRLRVEVDGPELQGTFEMVRLGIRDGRLTAVPSAPDPGVYVTRFPNGPWFLNDPVAYFIPEHADDPSRRPAGEELWVEVSVPPKGPPRPLRLGVRRNGVLTPLE
jgi:uncharacterized membrane-anchored protein